MSSNKWPSCRLFSIALLVGFGGPFHLGYQLTLTNPAQNAFLSFVSDSVESHYGLQLSKPNLESLWSVIIASMFVGGMFGGLFLRAFADRMGRKRGLIVAFTGIALSSAISVFSHVLLSFELYTLSRFTMGFMVTMSLGMCGLYLTECSPKYCRGFISTTTSMFVQTGLVFGSVFALPGIFGSYEMWWAIYLLEFSISAVVLCLISFAYESPGFLLHRGAHESALKSIEFFYGCDAWDAEHHLKEIKNAMDTGAKPLGMIAVLKDKKSRRPTIVGAMTAFAMSFSGVAVINAFAVEILRETGLSALDASLANVGLSILSLVGAMFSAVVMDRFGRRPLLLVTLAVIILLNFLVSGLMFTYNIHHVGFLCDYDVQEDWLGIALVFVIAFFLLAFSIGPGPLCYFITSEMLSQNTRSAGQGWTSLVQMTSRSVILAVYLPLKNLIGAAAAYFVLFVPTIVFCLVLFYYTLPETKNRNPQEVTAEYERLPRFPIGRRRKRSYAVSVIRIADCDNSRKNVF